MTTRLTIASVPPLVLADADILEVGELVLASGGASPGLTLTLDPERVPVTRLDPPPLRAPATLTAPGLSYQGLVAAARLGPTLTLTLES